MFFLPLPLNRTVDTLNEVKLMLYLILSCTLGRPTKSKVVWRSLVNINNVKKAINTLKSCNWLYRNVEDVSVDESVKHIIEISNNASTQMLEKSTTAEIDAFQAFTIRNLDNKLSTTSDIEQYKLLSVTDDPINNRQKHLDVMCFPVLFPTESLESFILANTSSLTVSILSRDC